MLELTAELEQRIAAYIDGELSPAEAAQLEVHLASTDPDLADRLVKMLADKTRIRAIPRPRAPADLADRISEQIERQSLLREPEPVAGRLWWQSHAAVAAGLALVLGAFSYFVASSVLRPPTEKPWTAHSPPTGGALADARPKQAQPTITESLDKDRAHKAEADAATAPTEIAVGNPAFRPVPPVPAPTAPPIAGPKSGNILNPTSGQIAATDPNATLSQVAVEGSSAAPASVSGGDESALGSEIASGGPTGGMGGMGGMGGGGGGLGGGMGAGGFGGGRSAAGGRGGGGRGGATGAGRAAPSAMPSVVGGTQVLPPTATNETQALAAVTRDRTGPMVITFYARSDADYRNLAAALAIYSADNAKLEGRTAVNAAAPANAEITPQMPADGFRQMQSTQSLNNYAGNTATFPSVFNGTLNGSGVITFTTPGGVTVNQGGANSTTGGMTNNNDQNATSRSAVGVNNFNSRTPSQVQQVAARGGPYSVALRPEQITELGQNYRLAIVARADTVVQFRDVEVAPPLTADINERNTLLRRAQLDATTTQTPPTILNQTKGGAAGPATPAVINCVITMEPAPRTGP